MVSQPTLNPFFRAACQALLNNHYRVSLYSLLPDSTSQAPALEPNLSALGFVISSHVRPLNPPVLIVMFCHTIIIDYSFTRFSQVCQSSSCSLAKPLSAGLHYIISRPTLTLLMLAVTHIIITDYNNHYRLFLYSLLLGLLVKLLFFSQISQRWASPYYSHDQS